MRRLSQSCPAVPSGGRTGSLRQGTPSPANRPRRAPRGAVGTARRPRRVAQWGRRPGRRWPVAPARRGRGRASRTGRETPEMPLLLHLADVHLGARHADMGAAAVQQRERQQAAFVRAIDVALRERVDAVLICGDLFDSNAQPRRSVERAASELRRLTDAGHPRRHHPGHPRRLRQPLHLPHLRPGAAGGPAAGERAAGRAHPGAPGDPHPRTSTWSSTVASSPPSAPRAARWRASTCAPTTVPPGRWA